MHKILAKKPRNKGQREKNNRHRRQLLHRLILIRRNGVEDEVNQILRRLLQLLQRLGDDDAVIQDVAQVRVRHGRHQHAARRVAQLPRRLLRRQKRAVITQHIDQIINGQQETQHLVNLADADIQTPALLDARRGDDVELQIAQNVRVGGGERDGEVDDGVNDGLDEQRGVARVADNGARGGQAGEDGPLDVGGGGLEEGDDGIVRGEEQGDLLGGDGHAVGREGGVRLHELGARLVAAGLVALERARHARLLELVEKGRRRRHVAVPGACLFRIMRAGAGVAAGAKELSNRGHCGARGCAAAVVAGAVAVVVDDVD